MRSIRSPCARHKPCSTGFWAMPAEGPNLSHNFFFFLLVILFFLPYFFFFFFFYPPWCVYAPDAARCEETGISARVLKPAEPREATRNTAKTSASSLGPASGCCTLICVLAKIVICRAGWWAGGRHSELAPKTGSPTRNDRQCVRPFTQLLGSAALPRI